MLKTLSRGSCWVPVWFLVLVLGTGAAHAQEPVDLELVLAADGSGSIDDEELRLQREGYAAAVRNPRVLEALTGGIYGKSVIAYVEWGAAESSTRLSTGRSLTAPPPPRPSAKIWWTRRVRPGVTTPSATRLSIPRT